MHQGNTIKVDDFDAGTGHSTEAIKSLLAHLKKQFVTDAKPGDGAASVTAAAAVPKKRGRAAKAEEGAEVWQAFVSFLGPRADSDVGGREASQEGSRSAQEGCEGGRGAERRRAED